MDFSPRAALLCVASAALLAFQSGCETDAVSGSNPQVPAATASAQLRPGDGLTVSLQGIPDPINNQVQVSDSETISLPFIGTISTANATPGELAQRIRETYIAKKFYTAVDVQVNVTERYVYVGGEVTRPGRIIWTPDLTVSKAIQAAGGFTLYAKESKVSLVRDQKAYDINVTLAQKNPAQDVRMMPNDSVQVSRSAF